MFVKIIHWIEEKPTKEGESAHFIEDSTTYECERYNKRWVTRVTDGKEYKDLILVMEPCGISVTIEKKKTTEIYFMNNEGRTIDSIHWL